MGIWKTIKAAIGRGTFTPPDARRLSAVDELALSASLIDRPLSRACAADSPPKPPPTITIRCLATFITATILGRAGKAGGARSRPPLIRRETHSRPRPYQYSRLRMLWHQSCTVVMPEWMASAAERRAPWYMSSGVMTAP
jgi:hypothetical protein